MYKLLTLLLYMYALCLFMRLCLLFMNCECLIMLYVGYEGANDVVALMNMQ